MTSEVKLSKVRSITLLPITGFNHQLFLLCYENIYESSQETRNYLMLTDFGVDDAFQVVGFGTPDQHICRSIATSWMHMTDFFEGRTQMNPKEPNAYCFGKFPRGSAPVAVNTHPHSVG
ncbi:hypothetical protein BC938DRAFT_475938 [Jimgerdemannia flammicorona]|uniref:Uncharacterized protein n=1 Tax=Jimgerdemannia flammicorona TaxID=994334 RepID=A0A433PMA3_9FUNG|nr:hypothetical protein BC938DRAFT_475938 [Jimgerdemannia flammicorona]